MSTCRFCGAEQITMLPTECCVKNYYFRLKQQERETWYRNTLRDGMAGGYLCDAIAGYTWQKSNDTENSDAIATIRSAKHNLFLFGNPGTGKTHAARCVLTHEAYNGATIAECSAPAAIRAMLTWQTTPLQRAIQHHRVVLIDDLDKVVLTQQALSALWEVMDSRTGRGKRTIVTSNVSPAELSKLFRSADTGNTSFASATLDRLNPVTVVEFSGKSLRRH